MRADASSLVIAVSLFASGCPPFQPDVALRPTPYDAAARFALAGPVAYRPDLDDHRLPTDGPGDPTELAAAPELVARCMSERIVSSAVPHPILAPGASGPDAFALSLVLTHAIPGWTLDRTRTVSASAVGPGGAASATATGEEPASGSEAHAAAILEIRASDGTLVDRVRIFAQRFPRAGEPIEVRSEALCTRLLDEVQHYVSWRLAGNG